MISFLWVFKGILVEVGEGELGTEIGLVVVERLSKRQFGFAVVGLARKRFTKLEGRRRVSRFKLECVAVGAQRSFRAACVIVKACQFDSRIGTGRTQWDQELLGLRPTVASAPPQRLGERHGAAQARAGDEQRPPLGDGGRPSALGFGKMRKGYAGRKKSPVALAGPLVKRGGTGEVAPTGGHQALPEITFGLLRGQFDRPVVALVGGIKLAEQAFGPRLRELQRRVVRLNLE